jgi:hypothetical protein
LLASRCVAVVGLECSDIESAIRRMVWSRMTAVVSFSLVFSERRTKLSL